MRILITGASSGVGAAAANIFASRLAFENRKAHLVLTGRKEDALKRIADKIVESHGEYVQVSVVTGDVSVASDVEAVCRAAKTAWSDATCDVAVLNAGLNRTGPVEAMAESDYDTVMNVNVKGVFLFLRELLGGMKESGSGQVVVTSSVLGARGAPNASLYCASKYALEGMVDAIRLELKGTGVKIGSIRPGAIATPWWTDSSRGGRPKEAPAPAEETMLTPEAVADAIVMMSLQAPSSDLRVLELEPTGRS